MTLVDWIHPKKGEVVSNFQEKRGSFISIEVPQTRVYGAKLQTDPHTFTCSQSLIRIRWVPFLLTTSKSGYFVSIFTFQQDSVANAIIPWAKLKWWHDDGVERLAWNPVAWARGFEGLVLGIHITRPDSWLMAFGSWLLNHGVSECPDVLISMGISCFIWDGCPVHVRWRDSEACVRIIDEARVRLIEWPVPVHLIWKTNDCSMCFFFCVPFASTQLNQPAFLIQFSSIHFLFLSFSFATHFHLFSYPSYAALHVK